MYYNNIRGKILNFPILKYKNIEQNDKYSAYQFASSKKKNNKDTFSRNFIYKY